MPTRGLFTKNIPIRIKQKRKQTVSVEEDTGGNGMRLKLVPGSTIANWNSGIAPSGYAGATLVNTTFFKSCCFMGIDIDTTNITVGAQVRIQAFKRINGVEVRIYSQVFTRGNDTEGLSVINGETMFNGYIRIELYSTSSSDNGKSLGYEYGVKY